MEGRDPLIGFRAPSTLLELLKPYGDIPVRQGRATDGCNRVAFQELLSVEVPHPKIAELVPFTSALVFQRREKIIFNAIPTNVEWQVLTTIYHRIYSVARLYSSRATRSNSSKSISK